MRTSSTLPPVSSVAWSTFATACNPGRHGIFGFTHPRPSDLEMEFPNSTDLRMPTLWDRAATDGLRSVVVNLPATYPARRVAGALVAGFVAPSLERACYPPQLAERLARIGYRIDLEVSALRDDDAALAAALLEVVDRRIEAMEMLLDEVGWSLAILSFTEADRLLHVAYRRATADGGPLAEAYREWYRRIDAFVGRCRERDPDATIVALSDHGFGPLRTFVNLDAWLVERGWLRFGSDGRIDPSSRAFSMDPGRIYVNSAGLFGRGSVPPPEVPALVDELAAGLSELVDPETGAPVVARVVRRREAYSGPRARYGPHLVCLPAPGYELKSSRRLPLLSEPDGFEGTHTSDDAFFLAPRAIERPGASLADTGATVLELLGLPADDVDGRSLVP